ncbi:MAG: metallophosphoesterase [Actinomycetota bacterium]
MIGSSWTQAGWGPGLPTYLLVAGDLTLPSILGRANVEYQDAYRILSRLRVPTYMTPGNHDLYDLDYDDLDRPHTTVGKELWPLYFGPSTTRELGPLPQTESQADRQGSACLGLEMTSSMMPYAFDSSGVMKRSRSMSFST